MNLWDKKAKTYARFSLELNEIQKATFEKIGSLDGKSIVDIGCGSGVWTLHLAKKAKEVLGVDNASAMLEILKEDALKNDINNIKTINLDFENFYKNNTLKFDLAFLSMSPALKNEEDFKAFLNLAPKRVYLGWAEKRKSTLLDPIFECFKTEFKGFYKSDLENYLVENNIKFEKFIFDETRIVKRTKDEAIENTLWHLSMNDINATKQDLESFIKDDVEEIIESKIKLITC